jgi:hypothetical protein
MAPSDMLDPAKAAHPVAARILAVNEAIPEEAFAGLPPAMRDALIDVLSHIKRNLALKEEVACDRPIDGSPSAVASAFGD